MLVRNVLVNGVKPYRAWGVYHGVPGSRKCIAEPLGPRSGRAVRTARRGVKSSRGGARGAGRASRRGVPARFRLRGSPRSRRFPRRDVDDYPGAVTLLRGPGHGVGRRGGACVGRPRPVRGCRVKRVPVSRVGPQPSTVWRRARSTVSSLKATLNEFQELDRKPQMRETSSAPSSLAIVRHPHP